MSEDAGLALDKLDLNALGRAKKVTISKDDTIVLDGAGEKAAIAERCDQLRESIDASTSDYDREKLQARAHPGPPNWARVGCVMDTGAFTKCMCLPMSCNITVDVILSIMVWCAIPHG